MGVKRSSPESGADDASRRDDEEESAAAAALSNLSVSTWMDVFTEIGGRSAVSSLGGRSGPENSSSSDS